ncbi:uncharacterized protein LOC117781945 [Drosophila innubila]|uniref:uncharacterized protein LOC117781945 n=1 Tax=Drosophila innubila TaxID=198719 RepID=UPI00148BEFB5|nr:uncharacterized protein LOC117781945 [Drosophila innubila]
MGKEKPRTRSAETPKSTECIPNKRQRKTLQKCNENAKKSLAKSKQNSKMSGKGNNSTKSNKIEKKKALKAVPLTDLNDLKEAEAKKTAKEGKTNACNKNNNCINMEEQEESNKEWKRQGKLLEALCDALAEPPEKEPETGYTHDDLKQFLLNSTIKDVFPFALEIKSTTALFQRLISAIYELETVQLDQLLDLYHLAIIMQNYQQLETHMGYRHELLDAVGELSVELQPNHIEYIGISLCDRLVIGTGMKRMEKVVDMHSSIVLLIKNSDVNCKIAMTTLLATISKIAGVNIPEQDTDVIKKAFEMAKLVDWAQLVESGREADMFAIVRSFSLIINTKENRSSHLNWHQEMGSDIHKFFMTVLRTVRFSRNYNFFAMMIERYIAFCVVRGATPRAYSQL